MKKSRKGFTLIELLIVIAIVGALSAGMSISSSNATAAAKATTIYNNISSIKTAAVLYQLQEGNDFKESNVDEAALKNADLLDITTYNTAKDKTTNAIQYKIVKGTTGGTGAYVVCNFKNDNDHASIAKVLRSYKNIRFNEDYSTKEEEATAVGAFLYHDTASEYEGVLPYDTDFNYTIGN